MYTVGKIGIKQSIQVFAADLAAYLGLPVDIIAAKKLFEIFACCEFEEIVVAPALSSSSTSSGAVLALSSLPFDMPIEVRRNCVNWLLTGQSGTENTPAGNK